jgi:hypothetical protein
VPGPAHAAVLAATLASAATSTPARPRPGALRKL